MTPPYAMLESEEEENQSEGEEVAENPHEGKSDDGDDDTSEDDMSQGCS